MIIDAPPVLGLPDVLALSGAADAILFVVRWDRTRRDAAAAALKQLADVSAEVAGVVLNQVEMKRHASYAYGDAGQYYSRIRQVLRTIDDCVLIRTMIPKSPPEWR